MASNFNWEISLSPHTYDKLEPLFRGLPDYKAHKLPKYSTLERFTTRYENDLELNAKICTGDDGGPIWTEIVLFQKGCETACSEISNSLDEELHVEYDGKLYTVRFTKSNTIATRFPHEKGGPA